MPNSPGPAIAPAALILTAILTALFFVPVSAHAQLLTGYDRGAPAQSGYTAYDDAALTFSHVPPEGDNRNLVQTSQHTGRPQNVEDQAARADQPGPVTSVRSYSEKDYDRKAPVDLVADNLVHDDVAQTITASGNVELVQAGRILKAQQVTYNLRTDTVTAVGDVALTEPDGNVHFAERVVLTNEMKAGFVQGLDSYLADGGHFQAKEGRRQDGIITMSDASYTPCECDTDKDGNPVWQIKAEEVTYNEPEHKISYKDAHFEIFGVPVFFTPYMAHTDGTIDRKSGFLTPSVGYDGDLGATFTEEYYWAIAPDRDATFGLMLTSRELPVALAEYRQRFAKAALKAEGSITYADREVDANGIQRRAGDDIRGHLFADAQWDINEKWRSGLQLELSSDDQYLREYNFTGKGVLESELYAERFSGRNYAVGRLLSFQDVRVSDLRTDQPNVLPEIITSFVGEPNAVLGGRWALNASLLGLQRDEDEQDVARAIVEGEWEKRLVTDFGLVNSFQVSARGDLYHVTDRDLATPGSGISRDATEARFFPQAHLVSSYPLVRPFESAQAVVEPIAAVTLAPDIDAEDREIPNEDSQDVQIDPSNLFQPNRFPGKDIVEDESHVTYGIRTGLYGYDGSFGTFFMGQSYRLDDDDNPFPQGSGLSQQESDFVGQVVAEYRNLYGINYRFQIGGDDFSSQRHELDSYADVGRFSLDMQYLFAKALEGTEIENSREQIHTAAGFDVARNWRLRGGVIYDLGENEGLREALVGVDYQGCCLSFSTTARRNITLDTSGESGTEILFRVGLKGLGEFASSNEGQWMAGNR